MAEKNREGPIDYSKPLKNKKHELFCINLLTMKRSEAYTEAGYKSVGDNARKASERLLSSNVDVSERFDYLLKKHNKELEEKGIISREKMIVKALKALNISLGEEKIKKSKVAQFEGEVFIKDIEVYSSNMSSFATIWDKLMNAFDYYPKEEEINIDDPVYLAKIFKKMPKEKLKEFMEEFKKSE